VPSVSDRILFDHSPDGLVLVDEAGVIRRANAEAERLFGHPEGALIGQSVDTLIPDRFRAAHEGHRTRFTANPSSRPMGVGMELEARRRDGRTFPVEISLAPLQTDEGRWVLATIRDVSLRKRLRDFGAGALRATEDERARIARELHDDTAQRLATILVRLRLLERGIKDLDVLDRLHEIRGALQDTCDGVRRIARGLRPPELEDAGLESALVATARRLRDGRNLEVALEVETVDHCLTPDGKLVLYRIVQEALNNVARHANSTRAEVRLRLSEGMIHCEVCDEGQGFVPGHVDADGRGMGIVGMQERAAMIGGDVIVRSQPGAGTCVLVRIPVELEPELGHV
jgi:PAS domain S-box-containing protein